MLRIYTLLWILITALLGFEFYALNQNPKIGILYTLKLKNLIPSTFNLSPVPGRQISLLLGYTGFGIMCLTNLYILRKRLSFLKKLGHLQGWLSFHIFCGLIGPTLIVFHCNFKVGGLVAISFWSMVVSFISGIIGRYFYINSLQVTQNEVDLAKTLWSRFLVHAQKANIKEDSEEIKLLKNYALNLVGYPRASGGVLSTLITTLLGDISLFFRVPYTGRGMQERSRYILLAYALARRRAAAAVPFQKLMGYWHAFHLPFAVFMYVVAAIHIFASLFFGV